MPFGLSFNSYQSTANTTENNYLYNGFERQKETEWYDYGMRMYDPAIGRWNAIDPLVEKYASWSGYNYVLNNPIIIKDINGADGVIVIRGQIATSASEQGAISAHRGNYPMYKMDFYNDMSVLDYIQQTEDGSKYMQPDASMYVARDAWGDPEALGFNGERSSDRYGRFNEAPAGTYYLEYNEEGVGSGDHFLRITSEKGKDYVLGADGNRFAIHMHEWSPHDALGCITLGTNGNHGTVVLKM